MRKLLHTTAAIAALLALLTAANAADVGVRPPVYQAPPAYVPPPFSWTGFYIGGNIGGAWGQGNVSDSLFGLNFGTATNNGVFIGGGQLGFNYQFGYGVLGMLNGTSTGPGITTIRATEFLFRALERSKRLPTMGGSRPWLPGSA